MVVNAEEMDEEVAIKRRGNEISGESKNDIRWIFIIDIRVVVVVMVAV